jgi:hypothetical protein
MRSANCLSAWVHVFSLLVPVGPPLGLGLRDERAFEQLAAYL